MVPSIGGRIILDVNPNVELVYENGILTEAIAYLVEGQMILKSAVLAGITAAESMQALLQEMADGGYLPDEVGKPCLLISVMEMNLMRALLRVSMILRVPG